MTCTESHEVRLSERALLLALRSGDEDAYARPVRSQTGRMLAVAKRYLRDDADAWHAVQDAFVSAFQALASFGGDSSLSTWLHRIVVTSALMRLRSRSGQPEAPIEDLLPRFLADGCHVERPKRWRECLAATSLRSQLRDHVQFCLDQLPDSYCTVLLLTDVDGFDTHEAAGLLGLSTAAVKTRCHQARLALRTLLDSCMRGETRMDATPVRGAHEVSRIQDGRSWRGRSHGQRKADVVGAACTLSHETPEDPRWC